MERREVLIVAALAIAAIAIAFALSFFTP